MAVDFCTLSMVVTQRTITMHAYGPCHVSENSFEFSFENLNFLATLEGIW
jgi:hypothetical protein